MTKEITMKANSNVGTLENHSKVQVFNHEMFGAIRTMTDEKGETFFVGKDVAQALGYSNTRKALLDHVDAEDRADGVTIRDAIGRSQPAVVINESGLYALVMQSKLPQAKAFKRWVTSEVLPQIRQTGGYIPTRDARTGEMLTEGEMVEAANRILGRTIARTNLSADDCLTASDIAKCLDVDVKSLNHLLVEKGVQFWNGSRYKLTPRYADCGYAEMRKFHYYALNGEKKERSYLVWTPQGKQFIESMFK